MEFVRPRAARLHSDARARDVVRTNARKRDHVVHDASRERDGDARAERLRAGHLRCVSLPAEYESRIPSLATNPSPRASESDVPASPSAPDRSPRVPTPAITTGPMFSGKSTELARRIRRHKVANRSCLVVKYAKDTRYESEPGTAEAGTDGVDDLRGCMITHDRQALVAYPTHLLADVDNVAHSFDVIGVDEGQFFPDVVAFCEKWANEGKTVIVAALDGDFKRTPFGAVLGLVPIAEDVTKLSAVCHGCGGDAAFTARAGAVATDEVELIGGSDLGYSASCRACFASGAAAAQAGKSPVGKAAKQKQLQQPSSTPSRPPSSASSAERARAKKRASVDGTPRGGGGDGGARGGGDAVHRDAVRGRAARRVHAGDAGRGRAHETPHDGLPVDAGGLWLHSRRGARDARPNENGRRRVERGRGGGEPHGRRREAARARRGWARAVAVQRARESRHGRGGSFAAVERPVTDATATRRRRGSEGRARARARVV